MFIIKNPAFVGLLLALALPATAQVVSLDSVLGALDRQNPMLRPYASRAAAQREYAEGKRSWMAPMVGGGPWMAPYPGQVVEDSRDRGFLMFSGEQALPNRARQRAQVAFGRSKADVEAAGRAVAFNQLRAEAKNLYYDWLVAERKLVVLRENQRILQTMKKLADIRYPYAQGSLGNVYKAEARLYEVENMLLMTAADIEQKRIRLNTLMNQPRQAVFQIDTTLRLPAPDAAFPDTTDLRNARSDVRRMNESIRSMQLGIAAQRTERLPELRLRYDHMLPLDRMMPRMFTLEAMVSIPIVPWASRMYKAEIKGMQQDIRAMQQEREAMLNEAQGMAAGMLAELRNLRPQLDNYQQRIIPALRRNYETLMIAYEQNKGELPVVIDGWESLNMAQMQYLERLQLYYQTLVSYEREVEK